MFHATTLQSDSQESSVYFNVEYLRPRAYLSRPDCLCGDSDLTVGLLPPVSESNIDARRRNRARCRSSGCPTVMVAKRKNRTIRDSDAGEPGSNPALGKQRSRDHPIDSRIADAPRREPSLRLTRNQMEAAHLYRTVTELP